MRSIPWTCLDSSSLAGNAAPATLVMRSLLALRIDWTSYLHLILVLLGMHQECIRKDLLIYVGSHLGWNRPVQWEWERGCVDDGKSIDIGSGRGVDLSYFSSEKFRSTHILSWLVPLADRRFIGRCC